MSRQTDDPQGFIEAQGWPLRRHGSELITSCPLCDKPEHLYMNSETGAWQCKRCVEKGNLWQLRRRLGLNGIGIQSLGQAIQAPKRRIPPGRVEAMHRALLADLEALDYCIKTRGWSLDSIKRFKIGLKVDGRGKWLAFPWMRRDDCVGVKYRILPAYQANHPQRFDREPGCESVLYNRDALDRHDEVILASGEADLLALATLGLENIVATTTGEAGLPAADVDALGKKQRVLIGFDNDPAGQKGAREAGRRIGFDRTWVVSLPEGVKDVNEFLTQGGTREQLDLLIAKAEQLDVPTVVGLGQALDRLEEEKALDREDDGQMPTPWPSLNRRLGHWRGGNLIVLSGPQGTGKTTCALCIAAHHAARAFPSLIYCLEMTVAELVQHVLCAHYRVTEEQVTSALIARARQELADWPLYLGANPRATGRKEIFGLLDQAVRRYGLKLLVFDNLHMLARSIEHRTEEVGVLSKQFKALAMEHDLPVVLIAQPRKLQPGRVMTPWDLKDSVDIFSDADQIILLHRQAVGSRRDRDAVVEAQDGAAGDNLSPLTLVRLAKARHRASRDSLLYFVGAEHRFRELEDAELPSGGVGRASPGGPSRPKRNRPSPEGDDQIEEGAV